MGHNRGFIENLNNSGRYKILELIGVGGTGEVYLAYDQILGRKVAIKFIIGVTEEMRDKILREAKMQAGLSHENICKIYEVEYIGDVGFIVMEYVNGRSLDEYIDKLSVERKMYLMSKICGALSEAHGKGIIHRDIKPSNIMIEEKDDGELIPFLMDFGIARREDTLVESKDVEVVGSPYFMSPEQACGKVWELDRRSDIYSIGATLYYFLSGVLPHKSENIVGAIYNVINKEPESLLDVIPGLSPEVNAIVMKCMEKDKKLRYQSAKQLKDDIERYLRGDLVKAMESNLVYKAYKWVRREKKLFIFGLIFLFSISIGMYFYLRGKRIQELRSKRLLQFEREVNDIRNLLKVAYLLPPHNISNEKREVLKKISQMNISRKELGEWNVAIAHYSLGEAYYYLGEYEKSLKNLKLAWKTIKREKISRLLGLLYVELYFKEYKKALLLKDVEIRKLKLKEINRYKDKALYFLGLSGKTWPEGNYFRQGVIDMLNGNYGGAAKNFEKIIRKDRSFYRALLMESDCWMTIYLESGGEKEDFFEMGEKSLNRAIEIGGSDPECYIKMADFYERKAELLLYFSGEDLFPFFEKARKNIDVALEIDQNNKRAFERKISIYYKLAEYMALLGNKKGKEVVWKGLLLAKVMSKKFPDSVEIFYSRIGLYELIFSFYWMDRNKMGRLIEEAKDYFGSYTKNLQMSMDILYRRAILFDGIANYKMYLGEVPLEELEVAINSYNEIISNFKKDTGFAVLNRGVDRFYKAKLLYFYRGENIEELFDKIRDDYVSVLKKYSQDYTTWLNLSTLYYLKLIYNLRNGGDFKEVLNKMKINCDGACEINKKYLLSTKLRFRVLRCFAIFSHFITGNKKDGYKYFNKLKRFFAKIEKSYLGERDFKRLQLKLLAVDIYLKSISGSENKRKVLGRKILRYGNMLNEVFREDGELYASLDDTFWPYFYYLNSVNFRDGKVVKYLERICSRIYKLSGKKYVSDREMVDAFLFIATSYVVKGDKVMGNLYLNRAEKVLSKYIGDDRLIFEKKFLKALIGFFEGKEMRSNGMFLKKVVDKNGFYKERYYKMLSVFRAPL